MSTRSDASTKGIKVTSGLPGAIYSMMAWFTVRSQTAFGCFLSIGGTTTGQFHNLSLGSADLLTLVYNASIDGAPGSAVVLNRRTHMALTCDSTGLRGYINGVQATTVAYNANVAQTVAWFGNDQDSEWLDCDVEDAYIFGRRLSPMDIRRQMMSDVVLDRANCTFAASFRDQTDLRQRTGRSVAGTLFGSPTRGTNLRGARTVPTIQNFLPLLQPAVAAGGAVTKFRKTFSGIGSRTGSRQVHGW